MGQNLTCESKNLATDLLADSLPVRWDHVQAVGAASERLGGCGVDVELLEAAGYAHDIGYSPSLVDTGFHPVDGARHLRSVGFDPRVVNLVANHSCAYIEARLHGLDEVLRREFPIDPDLPHDEHCWCDMTNGPAGQPMTLDERFADILSRYGPGSVVFDAITEATPEFEQVFARVSKRLNARESGGFYESR